ncbi:Tn3 family transposase, partial [Citrobacter freundii]|uniref:Tn3 family transposase n=1 Tax=Citrobacter freundii TaxID=546 RepID=UPI00351067C4
QNDVTLKMPAFEWVHVQLHQQKGMISLSPPTICNSAEYRRRILTQLNRGEGRHAVARAICYGQRGEIRKRYREGQEDQLGALGLVTNAVVLWNTLYMQEALSHLRSAGEIPEDEHISRLSPLMYGHINMLGHYTFTLPENILKGELRPLNFNSNNELLP